MPRIANQTILNIPTDNVSQLRWFMICITVEKSIYWKQRSKDDVL